MQYTAQRLALGCAAFLLLGLGGCAVVPAGGYAYGGPPPAYGYATPVPGYGYAAPAPAYGVTVAPAPIVVAPRVWGFGGYGRGYGRGYRRW